jgi:ABC-2 type transport system permease protein
LLAGEPVNAALGFGAISAWCLLLWPISRVLWRAGLRRYSAMGA